MANILFFRNFVAQDVNLNNNQALIGKVNKHLEAKSKLPKSESKIRFYSEILDLLLDFGSSVNSGSSFLPKEGLLVPNKS